ncbi:MAG: AAA family ATPase [[Ruminococcus] gnavus]|nr:AAA family ATPase [Mediterraneibacter gnavus]
MIKKVVLENFKCFHDRTEIEIKPLTILCGTNSSGKSSILKSLLLVKQTVESKSPDASLLLAGPLVDNGTFDDVVFMNSSLKENSFTIEHEFDIHNHKMHSKGVFIKRQDAKAFNELRRIFYATKRDVEKFNIRLIIKVEKQNDEVNEFSQYITDNYISEYSIYVTGYDREGNSVPECNSNIRFKNPENKEGHILSWNNIPGYSKAINSFENYNCTCSLNGLVITSVFAYDMKNGIKSIIPNILSIVRVTFAQYEGINFIAPLRQNPERNYFIKGNVNSVGLSGENTPVLLAKLKDDYLVNDFSYLHDGKEEPAEDRYLDIVQYWLNFFDIGELSIVGNRNAISIKLDNHNIADVGFGVSQILPIITQGIYMNKEETFLIEQPEIHLHPKMELDMADYLIELAKSERFVIVETHSDHIINRIVHRVMEKYEILNELIKIYFIENKTGEAKINPAVEIDKYKGTKNLYEDFFTQYATESKDIISTGLENMLGRRQ